MIDVEGLTKMYVRLRGKGTQAFDGVSFDVPKPSVFGFFGVNEPPTPGRQSGDPPRFNGR